MEGMLALWPPVAPVLEPWSRCLADTVHDAHGNASAGAARSARAHTAHCPNPRSSFYPSNGAFETLLVAFRSFDLLDGLELRQRSRAASPLSLGGGRPLLRSGVSYQARGPHRARRASYSGSVISVAGASDRCPGLVSGRRVRLAPDEGSRLADLRVRFPRSRWATSPAEAFCRWYRELSVAPGASTHVLLRPRPPTTKRRSWAPRSASAGHAFEEPAHTRGLRTNTAWPCSASGDHPIAPSAPLLLLARLLAVTEIEGASELLMLSKAGRRARVIREAVMACAANPV